ncbi:MAG: phosphotransferase enzyme family protein [Christensenellales bacterium]|jgi:Ser/Thr protein kinase RdoA (MazF antagonist)
MRNIMSNFQIGETATGWNRHGSGHINDTYLIDTDGEKRYILQCVNRSVFPDISALMENIVAVTEYLRSRTDDPRRTMTVVPTAEGGWYYEAPDGNCWRVLDFIEDCLCLEQAENAGDFYECGVAFGGFQQSLADFPAETLHEVIPNFHNTVSRYEKLKAAVRADTMGRAASVRREIDFAMAREEMGGTLQRMREAEALPLRVTHNDTKINNVLLDSVTRKPLCVVDLDTVMPGLAAYDFGDSIRFGAATAPEDERNLGKVRMDISLYRAYAEGYLSACSRLTQEEMQSLPLGAKIMTLECGVRFLTDYLEGDHYFKISREGQNLDRCRTQFKLVEEMEDQWEEMRL